MLTRITTLLIVSALLTLTAHPSPGLAEPKHAARPPAVQPLLAKPVMPLLPGGSLHSAFVSSGSPGNTPENLLQPLQPPPTQRTWYGWHFLIPDLAAYTSLAIAFLSGCDCDDAVPVILAGYVAGGPAVHLLRGTSAAKPALSLLNRLAIPTLSGLLAYSLTPCPFECHEPFLERLDEMLLGGLAGMLAASAVDMLWLAHDDRPTGSASSMALIPQLHISPTQVSAGVGLAF